MKKIVKKTLYEFIAKIFGWKSIYVMCDTRKIWDIFFAKPHWDPINDTVFHYVKVEFPNDECKYMFKITTDGELVMVHRKYPRDTVGLGVDLTKIFNHFSWKFTSKSEQVQYALMHAGETQSSRRTVSKNYTYGQGTFV